MTLVRFQSPFIHGAGSLDIKSPFNAPLDRYTSVDDNGNGLKLKLTVVGEQYFEIGSGTNTLTVNLSVEGEPAATGFQLLKNNENSSDGTAKAGQFNITVSESTDRVVYKVAVTNENGTAKSNGIAVQYVYPIYYGMIDAKPITSVNGLTKLVQPKGRITFENLESNYEYFCFAYPTSYGNIRTIQGKDTDETDGDNSKWNYLTAFEPNTLNVNNIEYNIYYIDINALYDMYEFTIGF